MIKKLSAIIFIIIILLSANINVLSSAYFYYPKEYNVKLKNVKQSDIKGYWIDSKVIKGNNSIRKFAIYENANVKYNNNEVIVTYSSGTEYFARINEMYLRIEKNDGTIMYSNVISSKNVGVTDENSSKEDVEKAKSVQNKKVYFEADISKADKYIDVVEIGEVEDNTTIVEPKHTYSLTSIIAIIIFFLLGSLV